MSPDNSPIDAVRAERVARERFGVEACATPLPGYGDLNFRLDLGDVPVGTLKFALEDASRARLDLQNQALEHVLSAGFVVPQALPGVDGHALQDIVVPDHGHVAVRVLSWVPGAPLGTTTGPPDDLEREVGRLLAGVTSALQTFRAEPMPRAWAWNMAHAHLARESLPAVEDAALRDVLREHLDRFDADVRPALSTLPKGWIHGDGNAWNVLVEEHEDGHSVSGLIDFGDLTHTARVADVAVALGYALLRHDGTGGARALREGYESVLPLRQDERALLPHLAPLRLAVSVAMSAAARQRDPDNAYLFADATPAAAWLLRHGPGPLDALLD